MNQSRQVRVNNWAQNLKDQARQGGLDHVATELPVALTYNRLSHVVMMVTPADLEDFALGFSLTEGIIPSVAELLSIRVLPREGGMEVAMTISEEWFDRLATQRRNLTGRTGCGLCGAERIEQALRYPEPVSDTLRISHASVQRALKNLQQHQPLQSLTGATHAAAWCDLQGEIQLLREDVGRHNALDKLLGALTKQEFDPERGRAFDPATGFLLISSRASYEMVYKAASMGVQLLVAVSAPTTLAIEFAERCGLSLVGFARPGRHNVYTFEQRIAD